MGIFQNRGENKTYLNPPPSSTLNWCTITFHQTGKTTLYAGDPKKAHFGASSATLYIDNFGVIFPPGVLDNLGGSIVTVR